MENIGHKYNVEIKSGIRGSATLIYQLYTHPNFSLPPILSSFDYTS